MNIPEEDDAHLVFTAIPSPTAHDEEGEGGEIPLWVTNHKSIEGYVFGQMIEMTKQRKANSDILPRAFPQKTTDEILVKAMDSFMAHWEGEIKTGCQVRINSPNTRYNRNMETFWFAPLVVNHVRRTVRAHRERREESPLEGLQVCLSNSNDDFPVHIVMDTVMTSEDPYGTDDEVASGKDGSFKATHLTPLAEQLEESMAAAKSVIKEMNYMERREARMRLTADSINSRVRFFSYISVGILLVVTYIQVTYLKRYFHKKKLL